MKRSTPSTMLLLLSAVALAACGSDSNGSGQRARTIRGSVTSSGPGTISVNGLQVSTAGATVRTRGEAVPNATFGNGMVVTVRGSFDDRGGSAGEIELEHGIEGQVDDKGTDFIVIDGQRVNVDDSTEMGEDNPDRLGWVVPGTTVVAVSGVPDDNGGLRASRIDRSRRDGGDSNDDDDFDLKGFVSDLAGSAFRLRISPDAARYYTVDASGASLPAGLGNGSYVEVHALDPVTPGTGDEIGTMRATRIELEDRFGGVDVEVEGIVSSGTSTEFRVDGVTVRTDNSTRWELGAPADLVPGVKVEAEGSLDSSGVLHAEKVSFRPGVRVIAPLVVNGASVSVLGVPVQVPSHARVEVPLANGSWVEVRANPSAKGDKLVALRINATSEDRRPQVRGVVSAKSAAAANATYELPFFTVTTAGATRFEDRADNAISAAQFHAAIEPGVTVIKARGANLAALNQSTFAAEELDLE